MDGAKDDIRTKADDEPGTAYEKSGNHNQTAQIRRVSNRGGRQNCGFDLGTESMKRVFSTSQIIGPFRRGGQDLEACATGEAQYDEERSKLVMELDSFVRPANLRSKEEHFQTGWLPTKQSFIESVSPDEAPDLARDIFHRWVGTVRQSVTSPVHN